MKNWACGPTVFYRWQKEFFENGAAAFQARERPRRQVDEKQKRIEFLEKKVQTKNEVLAEANPSGGDPVSARPIVGWFLFNMAHFLAQPEAKTVFAKA